MSTTRLTVRTASLIVFSVLIAGTFLTEPTWAQDIEKADGPLFKSASANTQDKDGFLLFLREAPSREEIRNLNELGVDLTLNSWVPPSSSGNPGFLYARVSSSEISSVSDLPFVVDYQSADAIETEYQRDQTTKAKQVSKNARLNPYRYQNAEDDVLKLHAISRARSSEAAKEWASDRGLPIAEGKVKIAIEPLSEGPAPTDKIRSLDGIIESTYEGTRYVWVPLENLKKVADSLGDNYRVRMPQIPGQQVIDSEAPERTEALQYHQAGLKGDNITIGVIDTGFKDVKNADLTNNVIGMDCVGLIGGGCEEEDDLDDFAGFFELFGFESDHGTAAAEMVADMAPEATLRLYLVGDEGDISEAVSNGLDNGVDVFSHSLGFYNTGWHDDTGVPASAANDASEGGSLFFNAAGNSGHRHWQGSFNDSDDDGVHEWNSAGDEVNDFKVKAGQTGEISLQWNRDGNDVDNYDLLITDSTGDVLARSTSAGETYEELQIENNSGSEQTYGIGVSQESGNGDFEIFVIDPDRPDLEHVESEGSLLSPSNATEENVITVGAVDQDDFTKSNPNILFYSSRGPTNDGNQALDLTGPTNTSTSGTDISDGDFGGTSAATPNAAGAAALLWDSRAVLGTSASDIRSDLLDEALSKRDWGDPGVDNTYGHGGVVLPDLPGQNTADVTLVLDRSGSMGFNGFIGPAKTSASNFVGLMQEGDGISVASFSSSSRVDFPFTRITATGDVKSNAQDAIASINAFGGTSIGAGMQAGKNELDKGNTQGKQGMVLLSDGFENSSPFVDDVLPNIPDRINIYTIALGANSDQDLLNKIASETGGFFSFSPSESGLQQIYDDIRTQITGQQTIASTSGTISQGETTTTSALIDQSVSSGIFSVQWSGSDIDLTLTDPNGQPVTPSSANSNPEVSFSSGNAFESYTITNPASGEWKLNVEGVDIPSEGEPFTTSVSGDADLEMNVSFDEPSYPLGEHIFVRAEITDDGTPVTGANVTAEVTTPTQKSARAMRAASKMKSEPQGSMETASLGASGSKQVGAIQLTEKDEAYVDQDGTAYYQKSTGLTLYDDGDHGDGAANDGVYANFFDETGTAGSYTFDVSASGEAPNSGEFSREGSRSTVVSSSAPTDNCPGPLTIADFDAEQSQDPDTEEYVEIENTGPSPASLDECALVFFDGADSESYFSMNLTGTVGSGGTVTVGNPGVGDMMKTFPSNTLQNGPDAIALYRDDASNFSEGTPVAVQNLISSVVYISDDNIYSRTKSARPTSSEKALMQLGEIAERQTVDEFVLEQNYPNPFGQRTTIRYALPEESDVEVVVYDVLGREVRRLASGTKEAGWHRATLRAEDLSSGTYFVRLKAGEQVKTQSMKLLR